MESNKTRTDLLNFLIEKHGLKSYLEIGLQNAAQNFDKIKCEYKVSVDPDPKAKAMFTLTSDDFFEERDDRLPDYFDLVFIDGLHTAEQVKKDFENAFEILSPNGVIVLHDCNPETEARTIVPRPTPTGTWNGDVYKFACSAIRAHNSVCAFNKHPDCFYTVDIDHGCSVFKNYYPIKAKDSERFATHTGLYRDVVKSWEHFDQNRKQLLNLISWDEFVSTYSHV